jgi:hypothetical protein
VGPRAGLDAAEKGIFLTLPGLELRPLGRPVHNQSLYRLRYPGTVLFKIPCIIVFFSNIYHADKIFDRLCFVRLFCVTEYMCREDYTRMHEPQYTSINEPIMRSFDTFRAEIT